MKFGQKCKDEQTSCLLGPRIESQDYFLNYKGLKKLIKKFTPHDLDGPERNFVQGLRKEIDRVEAFFSEKETQYFHSYSNILSPSVFRLTTGQSLDLCTEGQSRRGGLEGKNGEGVAGGAAQEQDARTVAGTANAMALSNSIIKVEQLQRFASFNLMAVVKIVKKHDKHAAKPIATKVLESLSGMKFVNSLLLPVICRGVEAMSQHLIASHRAVMSQPAFTTLHHVLYLHLRNNLEPNPTHLINQLHILNGEVEEEEKCTRIDDLEEFELEDSGSSHRGGDSETDAAGAGPSRAAGGMELTERNVLIQDRKSVV